MYALKMKAQRREEVFLNTNKFFMEGVAFLWPAQDEHLYLAKLVNSVKAPVQLSEIN